MTTNISSPISSRTLYKQRYMVLTLLLYLHLLRKYTTRYGILWHSYLSYQTETDI